MGEQSPTVLAILLVVIALLATRLPQATKKLLEGIEQLADGYGSLVAELKETVGAQGKEIEDLRIELEEERERCDRKLEDLTRRLTRGR